jgi:hypothetical protein
VTVVLCLQLGLDDQLIPPVKCVLLLFPHCSYSRVRSVVAHHRAMLNARRDRVQSNVYLKGLPGCGHIELTLAMSDALIDWVLDVCENTVEALEKNSS